jgi:EAL domain-containing protein (putative c-di-GMP-specific phosphodiesterase class I)/GGDEF domain-containing protein
MSTVSKGLFILPWCVDVGLILSNPFTSSVFFFDETWAYRHGPTLVVFYAVAVWYAICSVYLTLQARKTLSEHTIGAVSIFVMVSFLPGLIQFFFPDQLLQCLAFSISELFILLTIQNPEAFVDSGSGLFNRNGFATQVNLFLRIKKSFHVALVAVEDTAFLRRTFGLEYFDRIMRELSRYLQKELGTDVVAAGLGEAQFALILPDNEAGLRNTLETLQDRFSRPWMGGHSPIALSARICDIAIPGDSADVSDVFRSLDQLTSPTASIAKGKTLHIGDLHLADRKRNAAVERAILRGFENKNFSVYYQPIFSTTERRIVSAEALIRLKDEELGFVPPDEFIPISERNGTIHRIGEFVLDSTCAFMREEKLAEKGIGFIEINLSVAQCIQSDLPKQVIGIAKKHGLEPDRICLEITETAAAGSSGKLLQSLRSLSEAGFALALDDFGTGYSNIKYLMDLPFSHVKLDRSIVNAWFESVKGRIMLESSVAMFKRMDMKIVAEGVETAEQVQAMTELGCDYLQGYFFSKPVPAKIFLDLLEKG